MIEVVAAAWEVFTGAVGRTAAVFLIVIASILIYYEGVPFVDRVPYVGPWLVDHVTAGRVRRAQLEALQGYVAQSKVIALQAQLDETNRQLAAGRKASDMYAKLLAESQAREAATTEDLEARIAAHEKELHDQGRSWLLDQSDIDWLRK